MQKPIEIIILGAGSRGRYTYSPFSKSHPELMKIVGVAETDAERLAGFAKDYNIPDERCYSSAEELLQQPKFADAVIIATQDKQHYKQTIAALNRGYDILLEKPISPSAKECIDIAKTANDLKRHVAVCHVLRYTMFYQLVKFYIDSGKIGDIVNINQTENVGWWHQAHSFVRGNWRNSEETSPMILAKSCHDMDILSWLIGKDPLRVSSFGSLKHFKPECAPPGAAKRCMDGCKAKAHCIYDAEKIYIYSDYNSVKPGAHPTSVLCEEVTRKNVIDALKSGPYGRCVYHCDNDVVDHQVVNILFEDDITVAFTMCGHTTTDYAREITIYGTLGEIRGNMIENIITVSSFGHPPMKVNVNAYTDDFSGHGGGDNRMMEEFIQLVSGRSVDTSNLTTIDNSIQSHLIALAAEQSRINGGESIVISEYFK